MSSYRDSEFARSMTVSLRAGERRVLRAPAGSRWLAQRGEVRVIEAPRWLGERVVQVEQMLQRGTTHRVAQAGWLTLQATTDALLLGLPPTKPVDTLRAIAWRIIRSTRRALVPA